MNPTEKALKNALNFNLTLVKYVYAMIGTAETEGRLSQERLIKACKEMLRRACLAGLGGEDPSPGLRQIVILLPEVAAEAVCHEEQMTVWVSELTGELGLGHWLRDDLTYEDALNMDDALKRALRSIIGMAFNHSMAGTILKLDDDDD
jgi:hypothetical protein